MKKDKLNILLPYTFFCGISLSLALFYSTLREVKIFSIYIEIVVILVLFMCNCRVIGVSRENKRSMNIYMLLFVFRIFLLFYQSTYGNLPMGGNDWPVFHQNAINIMDNAQSLFQIFVPSKTMENRGDFFERIVALLYHFLGVRTQYVYFFSYIMSEIVFRYIYKLSYYISENTKIAVTASIIFYIWPMEMIFSVAYLREMTIQCVFCISLYFFAKYIYTRGYHYLFGAFILAYICAGMHSGMIAVLIAYMAVFFFYKPSTGRLQITVGRIIVFLAMFILIYNMGILDSVTGRFNNINNASDVMNKLDSVEGTTDYITAPNSTLGMIMQTPLRLFYFIVAPLPWHIRNIGTAIAFVLDGVFQMYAVYLIIKNLKEVKYFNS